MAPQESYLELIGELGRNRLAHEPPEARVDAVSAGRVASGGLDDFSRGAHSILGLVRKGRRYLVQGDGPNVIDGEVGPRQRDRARSRHRRQSSSGRTADWPRGRAAKARANRR